MMLLEGLKSLDFLSWEFYFLFIIFVMVYWLIPTAYRKCVILILSFSFYLSNGVFSLCLLLYLIGISWLTAELLCRSKSKIYLFSGVLLIVLPIVLIRIMQKMSGTGQLGGLGRSLIVPAYIGLAYTTMMALSYIFDIYYGRYRCVNFSNYAVYLSFFPYAVSGPIERTGHINSQIESLKSKRYSCMELQSGMTLILYGLFVKLVVADRIGILVRNVFEHYGDYVGFELFFALVMYGIEIYCDFSACSDIARGAAACFGIHIINNFQQPYFSRNINEFWHNWHISLSRWLRDYVYIPLGGNRKGKARQYINIIITFSVSGLWHGFSSHFVLWGLIHGCYQVMDKSTELLREKINYVLHINSKTIGHQVFQVIVTFACVDFAWLFFRTEQLKDVLFILKRMICGMDLSFINGSGWLNLGLDQHDWNVLVIGLAVVLCVDIMHNFYKDKLMKTFLRDNLLVKYFCWIILLVMTASFGIYGYGYDSAAFIYRGF